MKKTNECSYYTRNQCNLSNDMESLPCVQCRPTVIFVMTEPILYGGAMVSLNNWPLMSTRVVFTIMSVFAYL